MGKPTVDLEDADALWSVLDAQMLETPDAPPAFNVLAKPAGAQCNLDCAYCFYLEKEGLYPGSRFRMSDALLEDWLRQLIEAHSTVEEVTVAWQGGEPTLMGLDFFRRVVELTRGYLKPGQRALHTIQTNGTLIDAEWAEFFKENDYLVGISIDGPREVHDAYRVTKGGRGSFDAVMRGLACLREAGVEFNTLTTLHAANAGRGAEVYRFLREECGSRFMQFIPIVERVGEAAPPMPGAGAPGSPPGIPAPGIPPPGIPPPGAPPDAAGALVTDRSITGVRYGQFLIDVFEEWVRRDVGTVFVQMFDVALAAWVGAPPGLCVHSETCGLSMAVEHNGDLYACDHYVEPAHLLGNVAETPLGELVASPALREFGDAKRDTLPRQCLECDVRFACHGGCPKNRFIRTASGEEGLNWLCDGYLAFFRHVDLPMLVMADLIARGRAPAEIVHLYAADPSFNRPPRPDRPG